jgi:hypothetical protein
VLASDPLTYLRLDESPGALVAQDATLNDRDGSYAGAVSLGLAAPFLDAGTSVALDTGGTVSVPVDTAGRTIEL